MSRTTLSLTVMLLVSLTCFAQQSPDSKQGPEPSGPLTVIKSRSDLVLVPVVVKDKNGKHVPGLAKEAFQLEEKGKPQTISLFEEVQANEISALAAHVDRGYSNLPFDNSRELRPVILVLDLFNTSPLQRQDGREDFIKFLSTGLPANQPVSMVCITKDGLKVLQPFTTDYAVLIQALKKMQLGPETIVARINRVESTLAQLRDITQGYAGIPGRKTMILAIGDIPEVAIDTSVIEVTTYSNDLRLMWQGLIDANISVYPVQLMNWAVPNTPGFRAANVDQLMNQFAQSTGGNRCMEANKLMDCLAEAVDDSRSYYMLGFRIQPEDRKLGWRDLKVKVAAEHVDVRARNGFYYGYAPADDPKSVHNAELEALASPLPATGVPMYVKVLSAQPPASNSPGKTTVKFLMTIPLTSVRIDAVAASPLDLDIGAIALTPKNTEAGEFFHPVRGTPKPENIQQWTRDGLKMQEKLELLAGTYDVRFLVRDNNAGQIGTVVFPLDVK